MVTKTGASSYAVNLWSGETGADGKPVLGEAITMSYGHYPLPEGTVGIRAEHDSPQPFLKSAVQIRLGVRLFATDHVKGIVDDHMSRKVDTVVLNEAECKVSTLEPGAQPYATLDHTSRTVGSNRFVLTAVQVDQSVGKSAYVLPDSDPRQMAAANEGKQLGYVVLNGRVSGSTGDIGRPSADQTESPWTPYRPLEGTFYDLLPKGTTVKADSVTGVLGQQRAFPQRWADQNGLWPDYGVGKPHPR